MVIKSVKRASADKSLVVSVTNCKTREEMEATRLRHGKDKSDSEE